MAVATRPYHHGNLRSALLEAAERALARGGVQALSLREMARELPATGRAKAWRWSKPGPEGALHAVSP